MLEWCEPGGCPPGNGGGWGGWGCCGALWGLYGALWVFTGRYGTLWVPMGSLGPHGVPHGVPMEQAVFPLCTLCTLFLNRGWVRPPPPHPNVPFFTPKRCPRSRRTTTRCCSRTPRTPTATRPPSTWRSATWWPARRPRRSEEGAVGARGKIWGPAARFGGPGGLLGTVLGPSEAVLGSWWPFWDARQPFWGP